MADRVRTGARREVLREPARWPAFAAREAVLADLERAIAARPDALDARFYYASFLRDHGRLDEAIDVFERVRAAAPDHLETLVALGVALVRRGRRLDARAVLAHAVAVDGGHPAALVNLGNLLALDDPDRARSLFERALDGNPEFAPAHRGLCSLAASLGDRATAAIHRRPAFAGRAIVQQPYLGALAPIPVLALASTDGGNIPLDALIDPRVFLVHQLFVEAYAGEALPAHALIVNAIGDADRGADALRTAAALFGGASRIVNAPGAVLATERASNVRRLAEIPDIVMPATRRVSRGAPPGTAFPMIVRVPGLHMGRGMVRVEDAAAAASAHASLPGDEHLEIAYVDTRSADGGWRKYRVMIVDGVLYPLHLAIGDEWCVHYFSADMRDRPERRAEEARFLEDPAAILGERAWEALGRAGRALGLEYAGIDFALDAGGRAVIFEANAAMTVLHPDADERFAYRRAAAAAIDDALRAMLRARAG